MKLLTIREMNGTIKIEELADGNCVSVFGRSTYKTEKSAMTQINRLIGQGHQYVPLEDFAAEKARRREQRSKAMARRLTMRS